MTTDTNSIAEKSCKNNTISKKRHLERGASLISMSLFILTLGFLISGFLVLEQKKVHLENVDITAERKAEIDQALNAFIETEGRLPCPAPMTSDYDTATFGREVANCNTATYAMATDGVATSTGVSGMRVQTGAIPVRTLNLPDEYIIDAEDKRFTYAVTGDFAIAGANFDTGLGDITLQDQNGNDLGSSAGNIIYALLAQGKDTRGAYAFNGTALDACDTSGAASANCDWGADATFVDSLYKAKDAGNNTFTQSVSFQSSHITINWVAGPWSSCTPDCSSGTRTRVVTCEDSGGNSVDESNCIGARPADTETCTGFSACVWSVGSWGSCSPICGEPSNSYRSVECHDNANNIIADSYCETAATPKPQTQVACKFSPATNDGPDDLENPDEQETERCVWFIDDWEACNETCATVGNGTETRTVECRRDDNGNTTGQSSETYVDDTLCTSSKPDTSQSCTYGPYSWSEGGFGECSATCGGGTQTQTVTCQDSQGRDVSDCFCSGSGPKPAASQSCNTQACVVYAWEAGEWGECSATCGGGTQTRDVVCRGDDGSVGADSECSGVKPDTSQACNEQTCCSYGEEEELGDFDGWVPVERNPNCDGSRYGPGCSAADPNSDSVCVSRVWFNSSSGNSSHCRIYGRRSTCGTSTPPETTYTYRWEESGFGSCSAACGGGTQTQTVTCERSDNTTVADSYCSGTKPATSQACNTDSCLGGSGCTYTDPKSGRTATVQPGQYIQYEYIYSGYCPRFECDCDENITETNDGRFCPESRSIGLTGEMCSPVVNGSCGSSDGATMSSKPSSNLCSAGSASTVSGSGPWSWTCSGSGGGSNDSCSASKTAAVNGSCGATHYNCHAGTATNQQNHGSGIYSWTCQGSGGGSNDSCNEAPTCPSGSNGICTTNSDCNQGYTCNGSCCTPTARSYGWRTGAWGSCSETCGGGTQTRTVECRDDLEAVVADSFCNAGSKPATSQACNTDACATSGPWTTGSCSATCGGGTRSVTCDYDSCTGSQPSTSCNTQACPTSGPWTTGSCSATCGGGTRSVTCDYDSCTGSQPSTSCNTQACSEDGSCGSANGRNDLSGEPTGSAACSAGTRSAVSSNPALGQMLYSWSCNGTNGSSVNDDCVASGPSLGGGGSCSCSMSNYGCPSNESNMMTDVAIMCCYDNDTGRYSEGSCL